jgi:hypothetical protein
MRREQEDAAEKEDWVNAPPTNSMVYVNDQIQAKLTAVGSQAIRRLPQAASSKLPSRAMRAATAGSSKAVEPLIALQSIERGVAPAIDFRTSRHIRF